MTASRDDIYRAGGFDPATLEKIAEALGDDRMVRLLRATRQELGAAAARVAAAIARQDFDLARAESHGLRGAAANVGAVAVARAVTDLEAGLRDGTDPTPLGAAMMQTIAMADAALDMIEKNPLSRPAQG